MHPSNAMRGILNTKSSLLYECFFYIIMRVRRQYLELSSVGVEVGSAVLWVVGRVIDTRCSVVGG